MRPVIIRQNPYVHFTERSSTSTIQQQSATKFERGDHHNNQVRFKVGHYSKSAGSSSFISVKRKVGRHVTYIWSFHFSRAYLEPSFNIFYVIWWAVKSKVRRRTTTMEQMSMDGLYCSFDLTSWYKTPFQAFGIKFMNMMYVMFLRLSIYFPFILFDNHSH